MDKQSTNECWLWQATATSAGGIHYGRFYYQKRNQLAHRVAYQLTYGAIPRGKVVMHTCDNGLCVNPKHLKLGTQYDNVIDMYNKARAHNISGVKVHTSKLTEGEVVSIYNSTETQTKLSERYNVRPSTVSCIKRGKTWKHITKDL